LVPIGLPLTNTSIYLLDAFGELAPIGVKAEIYIGGAGVARGYLNRPELTAERFLADPFGRLDTELCTEAAVPRMYRTGDLGCRLADGTIKFLGRADSQVKVSGHRIELGEVEACLSTSPGVGQAAVIAYPNTDGRLSLAAFYSIAEAAGSQPGIAELRAHMRAALPGYMVPTRLVQLESLPLTPNGKLDRKALFALVPEPDTCAAGAYEAPASGMEVALARIWADILERKLSEIGRHDDFFELGGHSLSITKLISRLHEILNIKVAVAAVFAVPTLAGLALSLEHAARGGPLEINAELRRIREPADPHLISYHRRVSQRSGRIPAVYAIGEPTLFRSLALRLGDAGQPFFTICPLETELPYLFGQRRIEDIAGFYLELLRRAQPKGPYVLLGFCGAGAVAFEMARQLEVETQAALVILVDAWAPGQIQRLGAIKANLMRLFYGWCRRWWLLRQLPGSSFVRRLAILFQMLPYSGWALNRLSQGIISLSKSPFETLFDHFLKAAEHYRPPPCKQPALVIRSETQPQWRGTLSELGWSSFSIGPIDSAVTPGLHEDIFDLPYVEVMTRIILTCNSLARLRSLSKDR
jgi:thioesterase domain-containing protein